jgi:hypothetical protein
MVQLGLHHHLSCSLLAKYLLNYFLICRKYSLAPLKKGESLRGVEGDLFKKSPLTPLFQRGGLNGYRFIRALP